MIGWACKLYAHNLPACVEFEIPYTRTSDPHRSSYLWYCYACGKVYAELRARHHFDRSLQNFTAWMRCCDRCPSYMRDAVIPGSIWLSWDHEFLAALPVEVLNREFLLHHQHHFGAPT